MENLTDRIVEKIRENIKNNTWKPNEYIPPMRTIAETEGVSRGVVTAAISILVGENLLERVPRHGIKVIDNKKVDVVENLAMKCISIIDKHRSEDDSYREEDIDTLKKCFHTLMSKIPTQDNEYKDILLSHEEVKIYDKGIRCAGWSPDKYTLYKCNLTKDTSDLMRGNLLNLSYDDSETTFLDRTMSYVEKRVHPNDANDYLTVMNREYILEKAQEKDFSIKIDYREKWENDYRWIRLSLSATKDEDSDDVMLYLLYQNIDSEKKTELMLKERTDEDALTGALNRRAFVLRAEQLLSESDESVQHAFLMLDVDGFKAINDTFGHPVGDMVLCDLSKALHTILRHGDIFGRVGGDEFMICLKDVPFDAVIEKKAIQINELMRRDFDNNTSISGSIGIVVYPRDGKDYNELYNNMDLALYTAKENGKDRYEFYNSSMKRTERGVNIELTTKDRHKKDEERVSKKITKKKILIVDDVESNRDVLTEMIKDEYTVLQAKDGKRALLTLRRFGTSISAVLLDLIMPGESGYDVLSAIQRDPIIKSVPVIIVSGSENEDDEFKAIEMGAIDFIPKPVDKRLLKLRIKNSVNKQENERLRIQNSYLQLQSNEEQRYRYIIKNTGTIVIEHDWVNSVFTYDKIITQYIAGKYDHRPLWRILLSDMVASSMDVKKMQTMVFSLANSHEETQKSLRIQLKTVQGDKHWFEMKVIKIIDDLLITNKLFITLNDINDDVLVEEKLRYLVEYDSLTGIYNRTAFLEKASNIIKQGRSGAWVLSLIDISCFSIFNHLYGHSEGDKLLTYLANQLKNIVKQFGGVCGRLQADVFVVLHPAKIKNIENIAQACDKAFANYSMSMKISYCTGRYYIDDTSITINTILDRAMVALRSAKNEVKKDVYFTEEMQKKLLQEQRVVLLMEKALENNHFKIFFQPIYDFNTKRVVTAEALVRWVTPEGKIILPNEFIPIFEQNGFIVKLDAYVWEETCKQMRIWLDAGIDIVPISVNVSRMDIFSGNLVNEITEMTSKYKINPSLLRLEITESAYMVNPEMIVAPVEELQRLGFKIEMDDFGSGFSSLNILSEVPVDILKLDMRFLMGEDRNRRKNTIMEHIINMAKSSNMDIIAEGVETREQAEMLCSLGCVNMQGYYFSKPIKGTDFQNILQTVQTF